MNQVFFQHYDKNHDQLIQFKEFKLIKDFSPYPHPNQTEFQGNNGHQALFLTLSQNHNNNHNHPLTKNELMKIWKFIQNPCALWEGSIPQHEKHSYQHH